MNPALIGGDSPHAVALLSRRRVPVADEEGRVAVVAARLGELVEDLLKQAKCLPRWRPAPIRRAALIAALEVAVKFYQAWRDTA